MGIKLSTYPLRIGKISESTRPRVDFCHPYISHGKPISSFLPLHSLPHLMAPSPSSLTLSPPLPHDTPHQGHQQPHDPATILCLVKWALGLCLIVVLLPFFIYRYVMEHDKNKAPELRQVLIFHILFLLTALFVVDFKLCDFNLFQCDWSIWLKSLNTTLGIGRGYSSMI